MNNKLGKLSHWLMMTALKLPLEALGDEFSSLEPLSPDEIRHRQWVRLQQLVHWAHENSPFYRQVFDDLGASPHDIVDEEAYARIPALTKDDIRNHGDRIVVRRGGGRLFKAKTSGSTGKPLVVWKNHAFLASTYAAMYRGHSWHGVEAGDREGRLWGVPVAASGRIKMKLRDILLNRVRQSSVRLSDELFGRFTSKLRRFKPAYLMGYPSFVYLYARYLRSAGIDGATFDFTFVKTTAEHLPDFQKDLIESVFGCPCIEEYGAAETGIISFECPRRNRHIIAPSVYVEFLPPEHETETEDRDLAVTSLYSHSFPLLRYRLGDLAHPVAGNCGCGINFPLMSKVVGRISEVVVGLNRSYHSAVFSYLMKRFIERGVNADQYRFTQSEPGLIEMEIEERPDQRRDGAVETMKDEIVKYFGDDLQFTITRVAEIPRMASGKHRYFVSNLILPATSLLSVNPDDTAVAP